MSRWGDDPAGAEVRSEEVEVVISATNAAELSSFLEAWRDVLQPYHLIIVQDPDLADPLHIPEDLDHHLYCKEDMESILGPKLISALCFSGDAARSFGFLQARRRYVFTMDLSSLPLKDAVTGTLIDPIQQHLVNLKSPSTPFFFNTLYDPYQDGTDFVRGYPFSLRLGLPTVISHGLWLNAADFDAPTRILKPNKRNLTEVDAVVTIPRGSLFPMSAINLAFDRRIVGPAMFYGLLRLASGRSESFDDIWAGLCCKVICDHIGYGVKSGKPYVWQTTSTNAFDSLKKEYKAINWLEEIIPFFQSIRLPRTLSRVEDCYLEIAKLVKRKLNSIDPVFEKISSSMEAWIEAWKAISDFEEDS
ncbi:hypothetical protein O6H91_09G111100 [Diphasiastrum complanatum]|uniref:Uncharacterized protein n=2 Tax=Diphasiastrum complanatum TaxID=34168 RepID=A0ACC2B835_DIPCM|nr:hypothetical protein O6H91_17G073700 [Diphasiastrum complanatum]KAJ7545223.1 hypothetical protein O6H91_09G111100 [Diphasiastrum complanatum]